MLYHNNYDFPSGEANYALLPAGNLPSGNRLLDFYVAYAQYSTEVDRLDVMYSTNCGTSWTSVWNQAGATLATAPPTTARFVPTQAQWKLVTVDLSAVPATAMLALRATSNYGNSLYVDDVTLRPGTVSAVANSAAAQAATLAPNPATAQTLLSFELARPSVVRVEIVDALGRIVATPAAGPLSAGSQQVTIGTAALPTGLYQVVVHTADGTFAKRLSIAR